MVTYLYCLLPSASERPTHSASIAFAERSAAPLAGIGGAPVRELQGGGMVAWVSDIAVSDMNEKDIRSEHARVVLAALASGETPLPARAGQTFPDDGALWIELEARSRTLGESLMRLRGMVEMTLIVQLPPSAESARSVERAAGAPSSGRAYLEQLRAEYGAFDLEQDVGERIRSAARSSMADVVEADAFVAVRGQGRFVISHLVKRERAEEWRSRAVALNIVGARRTFVAGPLPPYSFASIDGPPIAEQRDSSK